MKESRNTYAQAGVDQGHRVHGRGTMQAVFSSVLLICCCRTAPVQQPPPMEVATVSAPSSELEDLILVTLENAADHYGINVEANYTVNADQPSAHCGIPVQGEINGRVDLNLNVMREFWNEYGDVGIVGVVVHEMSHIATCALIQSGKAHQRDVELLADCLTGDYMATYYPQNDMSDQRRMWADLGDFEFNAWGHHGTPEQRHNAFLEGFRNRLNGDAQDPVRATMLCLTPIGYTF